MTYPVGANRKNINLIFFDITKFHKDIEKFYAAVDAVYIATPHQTHYEYIKSALEHGKHVLCEKPIRSDI